MNCPVCADPDCHYWKLRQTDTWHAARPERKPHTGTPFTPWPPVPPGNMRLIGSSPDGAHLEFLVHPGDVERYRANGLEHRTRDGKTHSYWVTFSPSPYCWNGDVQIVAKKEAA